MSLPVARDWTVAVGQQLLFTGALERTDDQPAQIATGINRGGRPMGVVRELSPERSIASAGWHAYASGTGGNRISEPLPADMGSVEPQ